MPGTPNFLLFLGRRSAACKSYLLWALPELPGWGPQADLATVFFLRAWRFSEPGSLILRRRAYVYNPDSKEPNLAHEGLLLGLRFSEELAPQADSLQSLPAQASQEPRAPIVMRGSLFRYRRSQARSLLAYFYFRGRRRRHLSLLFRNFLSRSGSLLSVPGADLMSSLCRVFFFISPASLRSALDSGSVLVNFKREGRPLRPLRHGDFVSVHPSLLSGGSRGGAKLLSLFYLLEGERLRLARRSMSGLTQGLWSRRCHTRSMWGAYR